MSPRTRLWVVVVTAPVLAFTIVGGYLGRVTAQGGAYRHLRVFDDVVNLITSNYVEEVDLSKVMRGALRGLAEGLDGDSAYFSPEQVRAGFGAGTPAPSGDVGVELTRQYYLRIVAVHDQSPAARAGLMAGDFVRAIEGRPTRELSAIEGQRSIRGAPGSKVVLTIIRGNTADPHDVTVTREAPAWPAVTARMLDARTGLVRIAAFPPRVAEQVRARVKDLTAGGALRFVLDVRNAAAGEYDQGIAVARLFVRTGTLAIREDREGSRTTIAAGPGDGQVTAPVVVLADGGTSGPAELLAGALGGNHRAELVGERTAGRVAIQRLIRLPDGGGLWLSHAWYRTPSGNVIHERGLPPDVGVEAPDFDFGAPPPQRDAVLEKGRERLSARGPESAPAREPPGARPPNPGS